MYVVKVSCANFLRSKVFQLNNCVLTRKIRLRIIRVAVNLAGVIANQVIVSRVKDDEAWIGLTDFISSSDLFRESIKIKSSRTISYGLLQFQLSSLTRPIQAADYQLPVGDHNRAFNWFPRLGIRYPSLDRQ